MIASKIIKVSILSSLLTQLFILNFHLAYQSIFKSTSYKRSINFYLISLLSMKLMMLQLSEI